MTGSSWMNRAAMRSISCDGEMNSTFTGRRLTFESPRRSGGMSRTVRLMRSRRSMSTARLSRKIELSAWPAICASEGYTLERARFWSCVCRPVPTISTRSAPRCSAGDTGAIWRIEPSPKYSRCTFTAGKMNGSAADASRYSTFSVTAAPMRWLRSQPSSPLPPWKNDTLCPVV